MKRDHLPALVEALRPPIQTFIREARVRIALLVNGAGQVLAQHGFTRSYEIMNVASLAAAAHASSQALAGMAGAERWLHLYHGGARQQLFLAPLKTAADELILVVIFDGDSSLGIVRLFYQNLEREIAGLDVVNSLADRTDQANFERDLEAGLEFLSPDASED